MGALVTIADIAGRIRTLREGRRWNQVELARRAGLSSTTINKLENRKRRGNGRESLEKIARAFGLTVEQLLYGEIQGGLVTKPRVDIAMYRRVIEALVEPLDRAQAQEIMQVVTELIRRTMVSEGD